MFTIPDNTKAILFDLGGVLMDLHMEKTYSAFAALGFMGFEKHFDSYSGSPFIELFEEGRLTPEAFISKIKENCTENTTNEKIREAWNAMLGEISIQKIELLQVLKKKYLLFLYSNTNALHVAYLHQYYDHLFGTGVFQQCFTKIYYSYEMGIRKPHAAGFLQILAEQKLLPEELFYIDDGAMHIATAKKLGINSLFWKMNRNITTALQLQKTAK
jgi:putative hydrolase of the HAD superfamily